MATEKIRKIRCEILDTIKRIVEVKKLLSDEIDVLHRQIEDFVNESK